MPPPVEAEYAGVGVHTVYVRAVSPSQIVAPSLLRHGELDGTARADRGPYVCDVSAYGPASVGHDPVRSAAAARCAWQPGVTFHHVCLSGAAGAESPCICSYAVGGDTRFVLCRRGSSLPELRGCSGDNLPSAVSPVKMRCLGVTSKVISCCADSGDEVAAAV